MGTKARYTKMIDDYTKQKKTEAANRIKESDETYDTNARNAYVAYRKAQAALPGKLSAQGIKGGASETSMLRSKTNYGNQAGAIRSQKANAARDIQNTYQKAIDDFRLTETANMDAKLDAEADELSNRNYNTFIASIGRYNTTAKAKAAIKALKKAGAPSWKIWAIQEQLASLQDSKKSSAGSSGSYSGGSSGGSPGSSSGASVASYGGKRRGAYKQLVKRVVKGAKTKYKKEKAQERKNLKRARAMVLRGFRGR